MSSKHEELFWRVANQRLDRLEVLCEEPPDEAALAELRRELHTLKGEANVLGRRDIGGLIHSLESCFEDGSLPSDPAEWPDHLDLALETYDLVRVGLQQPEEFAGSVGELLERLAERGGLAPAAPAQGPALAEAAPAAAEAGAAAPVQARLNVGLERLDLLSSEVERAALARSSLARRMSNLTRSLQALREEHAEAPWLLELRRHAGGVLEDIFALEKSVDALSETVRDLRLAPIDDLFLEFRRPLRDLSRRLGKEVELVLEAGQTELDQTLVDLLREPLLHLVQNALDHGLEPAEERQAAGKPAAGTIRLHAESLGTRVLLSVSDDGRGLDPAALRARAVERGVIGPSRAKRLSDAEALDLAFAAGISTKDELSEVSGRGIGLDVVRTRLEQHRGRVWLESSPGAGTTFYLELPVSLLLVPALHVEAAQQPYSLAVEQIERVTRLATERVHLQDKQASYAWGDELVPLIDLPASLPGGSRAEEGAPLILISRPRRLALVVDRVLGHFEVVFRALDPFLQGASSVRSACVLPDGRVALLLSPEQLGTRRGRTGWTGEQEQSATAKRAARVLVADDSPVTRELLVEIVRSGGMEVTPAEDGQEALELLQAERFDLLLTDLEMPRLDGAGLARAVRDDAKLADLPVVIITTRGSAADRRACLAAGADAFLDKSRFDEGALIRLLERLLA